MRTPRSKTTLLAAAWGATAFLVAQGFLLGRWMWQYRLERIAAFLNPETVRVGSRIPRAWWLKSPSGQLLVCAVLFAAAILVLRRDGQRTGARERAMIGGAIAAMVAALLLLGPGTLWLPVLLVGSVEIALAVLAGAALGRAVGGAGARSVPAPPPGHPVT